MQLSAEETTLVPVRSKALFAAFESFFITGSATLLGALTIPQVQSLLATHWYGVVIMVGLPPIVRAMQAIMKGGETMQTTNPIVQQLFGAVMNILAGKPATISYTENTDIEGHKFAITESVTITPQ